MVHSDVADTVDRTLRDIMHNQHPFGGKCVVWMGDFKQLLPVVRYGKGFNFTMQRCSWWKSVTKLQFTCNWRAIANPEYTAWLEDIGRGVIDRVVVPDAQRVHSYADMIDIIYGDTVDCPQSHQILALTLETCAVINRMCFEKMPGALTECPAADSYIDCPDRDAYPPEYVESLPMHGAPPYMIQFKIGARYMCIKNIDIHRGLINGTMMRLLAFGRRCAQFQILSGKCAGSIEIVTKAMFTITPEASGLPFAILRRQYPIIPAYCLSVHKAQGQSLLKVGIIFESDPFTHGQL
jgi:ATP-dependent DNA helicase PIF1